MGRDLHRTNAQRLYSFSPQMHDPILILHVTHRLYCFSRRQMWAFSAILNIFSLPLAATNS